MQPAAIAKAAAVGASPPPQTTAASTPMPKSWDVGWPPAGASTGAAWLGAAGAATDPKRARARAPTTLEELEREMVAMAQAGLARDLEMAGLEADLKDLTDRPAWLRATTRR